MHRLKEISDNVEADQLNIEKYVKELTDVVREMFMSTGSMFQQESLRVLNTLAAQGGGGYGAGGRWSPKAIMEHKVIQHLRAVNGDKSLFRQWHQKFTTALGQVHGEHEEVIQRMVKEIDLGKTWYSCFNRNYWGRNNSAVLHRINANDASLPKILPLAPLAFSAALFESFFNFC